MRISSISDEDIQLLKAIKPFMSSKSKGLLDIFITIINIFKPESPEQTLNIEALTEFLTLLHESFETQKLATSNKDSIEEIKRRMEKRHQKT